MHPRYRKTCRVCGSTQLTPVIDLGAQYLQGSFVKPGMLTPPMRRLPTQLVRCDVTKDENGCGLLQLAHSFPPEILYANYWYRSGTNATMRNHLAGIVESALSLIDTPTPTVVDIGCNDGTLLSHYPEGSARYGVDPSDIASEIEGDVTVINTVFPSERAMATLPAGGIDVLTSIAMFYDLESPVSFAQHVAKLLGKDGIWILEMSYLPLMLLQNSFDTICHEHLEYYSLTVLETIAALADLRIFKVEINDINGGSIRCYACHDLNDRYGTAEDRAMMSRLRSREFEMELDTDKPYMAFQSRVERLKDELNSVLFDIRATGRANPYLRRFDEGQRVAAVVRHQPCDRGLRGRSQSAESRLQDPRDRYPDRHRRGIACCGPGLLSRASLALQTRVPRARTRDDLRRDKDDLPTA